MTGTFINAAAILSGGMLGLLFGGRLPQRIAQTIVSAMGLFTGIIGIQMFLKTQNSIIVLMSLLAGGLLGEWWKLENGLHAIGVILERHFGGNSSRMTAEEDAASETGQTRFIRGFMTASLLFCIGPMAILGSIQDGMTGDYKLLVIKSILDGFASLAFASTLGVGVLFSALMILIYQGTWTLLAAQAQAIATPTMMNELTATGGVLLVGIAISSLLEIKPIRVGNLLPALVIAPIIAAIFK